MRRSRDSIAALLCTLMLAGLGGCVEDRKTAVLLIIDYGDLGQVDQFVVQVYPEDRYDDIGLQVVPEIPSGPLSGDSVSVLVVLPERWAERNLVLSVVGNLSGLGVGQGSVVRSFPEGEVTELELQLTEGGPFCGNGILEALEQCDGTAFRGDTCPTTMGLELGAVQCTSQCLLDVSQCYTCGNSAIEAPEECDSDDFGGASCVNYGFAAGYLTCDETTCRVSQDNCIDGCGNNVAEAGEICDGTDFGGQTCETVAGLGEGQLGCTTLCQLDISGCHQCGNGAQEADEDCDGVAFGGLTCADFGFGGGALTCDGLCHIDTTSCCGDGVRGPGEVCDGTDFGLRTCVSETGHGSGSLACTGACELDRSGCHSCGNGAIEGPEVCDGQEFGGVTCQSLFGQDGPLGCSADCTALYTAGCMGCGNGTLEVGEACDDDNLTADDGCEPDCSITPGWSCDTGEPSGCWPNTCTDNGVDPGEVCDGADLNGETCLTQGYVGGGGSLACNAVCTAFDFSNCLGGVIEDGFDLQAAVNEAYATGLHQEIVIITSPLPLSSSVTFDECSGPCGSAPAGVTIRSRDGQQVVIETAAGTPAFDVISGNNVFQNLRFRDASAAIRLQSGTFAGGNTIRGNVFENPTMPAGQLVEVDSKLNVIEANRFDNASGVGVAALIVSDEGNIVSMNVFDGYFDWTVMFHTFTLPSAETTYFDHNSIRVGSSGGGVFFNSVDEVCYRNNIVYGDGSTTGLYVAGNVVLGSFAGCNNVLSQANVNANHATLCTDTGCAAYCNGIDPSDLCDLTTPPGWSVTKLCLSGGNSLIDGAVPVPAPIYDFNDATPAVDYIGSAPDIGAREDGTSRTYGGSVSSCP